MSGIGGVTNNFTNQAGTGRGFETEVWQAGTLRQHSEQLSVGVAKSEREERADLERKIRNREIPCPACSARKYKDESDDAGVSFKAAQSVPASTAGVSVLRHEQEHVMFNDTKRGESEGGYIKDSTVSLRYDTCPECGRRYVAGGVTTTRSIPSGGDDGEKEPIRPGELDTYV